MTQSTRAILSSLRGAALAATIVGTSGVLDVAGIPIFTRIVQNLGAAQSEARRLRDKAAYASAIYKAQPYRDRVLTDVNA
jgi:hypothetical protein